MEEKILPLLRQPMATWVIANAIGMRGKTRVVLREMKRLESTGAVKRNYHTTDNNIVWELSR